MPAVQMLVAVELSEALIETVAQRLNTRTSRVPRTIEVPIGIAAQVCGLPPPLLANKASAGEVGCVVTTSSAGLNNLIEERVRRSP